MKPNYYALISDAVEEGIRGGVLKAEKRGYLTLADEEAAVDQIHNYVMNSICERFNFDD